ncbi:acyl-CoA dehydrogenase family protein [Hyphococcus luteus]|uniref:Acyl-CoA dehydrogenase n=1 Tax=Hyphococcus luteus TaxID=2058213 RepID=A0A2S7K055_9PROT|nr:acyl-CoA dehydrogenase family protein [Marinicaulis flavus]PQA85905.1 acyl-CoA dehydrogenase [Marinicaulis flavus]
MGYAELKVAAEGLRPLIEAEADEAERLTHLTDKTVEALQAAGLYTMLLPKELGGEQVSFSDAIRIIEDIAYADGSAGWCTMVAGVASSSVGAFIPDAGAEQIYGDGPKRIVAGQGVPRGLAQRTDGGFIIEGNWSYGSGIYHAEIIHSGCTVMRDGQPERYDDGRPIVILAHFDREHIDLGHNWDVLGLRGTGSYDYSVKNLFVPDDMCYEYAATEPLRGGNQYSLGLVGFTSFGHTAWAIGVGRRTLDELAEIARTKANPFGVIGDSASFKEKYAHAEAKYRSARAFCYEAWDDLSETLLKGRPATNEQIALIRLAMRHIHDVISENAVFAHINAGGASLRKSRLQRCFRDIHAGTQHVLLSDQIVQACGQVLEGRVGDKAKWNIFGVLE